MHQRLLWGGHQHVRMESDIESVPTILPSPLGSIGRRILAIGQLFQVEPSQGPPVDREDWASPSGRRKHESLARRHG